MKIKMNGDIPIIYHSINEIYEPQKVNMDTITEEELYHMIVKDMHITTMN